MKRFIVEWYWIFSCSDSYMCAFSLWKDGYAHKSTDFVCYTCWDLPLSMKNASSEEEEECCQFCYVLLLPSYERPFFHLSALSYDLRKRVDSWQQYWWIHYRSHQSQRVWEDDTFFRERGLSELYKAYTLYIFITTD